MTAPEHFALAAIYAGLAGLVAGALLGVFVVSRFVLRGAYREAYDRASFELECLADRAGLECKSCGARGRWKVLAGEGTKP